MSCKPYFLDCSKSFLNYSSSEVFYRVFSCSFSGRSSGFCSSSFDLRRLNFFSICLCPRIFSSVCSSRNSSIASSFLSCKASSSILQDSRIYLIPGSRDFRFESIFFLSKVAFCLLIGLVKMLNNFD